MDSYPTEHGTDALGNRVYQVVGFRMSDDDYYDDSFDDDEEMAEERRLFYVGLTRARDRVIMTYSFLGNAYGDGSPGSPSRFLADIPEHLLVGDSANDLNVARNAGIPVILVTFGYTTVPVQELGADALIDHFDQLLPALDKLA